MDTKITLYKLEIFELVVELESVSRAADQLWLAQPVVTAHIRSLEQKLGVTLFKRQARRMELTEAGAAVHHWAQEVLRRTSEATRDLEGLAAGTHGSISIGASLSLGSYVLPAVISAFKRDRPTVTLKLDVSEYTRVIADVEASVHDFGVLASPAEPSTRRLAAERIGTDELVAVTAAGTATSSPLTPEEFSELPFVQVAGHAPIVKELSRIGIHPREIALDLGHPEAAKCAVKDGLGVSVLFRSAVARELDAGELAQIELEQSALALGVYLVYPRGKRFAPAEAEMLERIRRRFTSETQAAAPA